MKQRRGWMNEPGPSKESLRHLKIKKKLTKSSRKENTVQIVYDSKGKSDVRVLEN